MPTPLGPIQTLTVSNTAVGLTVPQFAHGAVITVETNDVRWRDDGTNPTAAVGELVKAGSQLLYTGGQAGLLALKLIRVSADAALTVAYYDDAKDIPRVIATTSSGGGSVTQGTSPWVDNVTQLGGTAIDTNSGAKSAGTLRVVLATDQPSLTNEQPVKIADGSNIAQGALADAAWASGNGSIVAILKTVATRLGLGQQAKAASLPVTVASDQAAAVSSFRNTALKATATAVKSSAAGELTGWHVYNQDTADTWLHFYDVATAGGVTVGTTTPKISLWVPASGAEDVWTVAGLSGRGFASFTSGIQVAATTTLGGSTNPTNGLVVNLGYL